MNFHPPISATVVLCLAAAAVGVAIWREVSGARRLEPKWLHLPCLLFRLGAIAALVVILLNPSYQVSSEIEGGRSVVLIDASASMNLAAEDGTRWDAASTFADRVSKGIASGAWSTSRVATFSNELDIGDPAENAGGKATNLGAALEALFTASPENYPSEILILSDGRIHDRNRLETSLALATAARVPISTRTFGIDSPPRNASLVAVQAPRMVRPRSPVAVHVDVAGTGIGPDENLNLKLFDDEEKLLTQVDFFLPQSHIEDPQGSRPAEQVLVFESGLRTGRYHLQLSTGGEPEVDLDDNRFSFSVEIATGKLRVLFAEGTHWKRTVGDKGHCWNDMELMSRAWEATGEIEHVSLTPWSQYLNEPNLAGVTFHNGEMLLDRTKNFPKTREELNTFDVVIISDVSEGNFSEEQMEWVVDLVEKRGGGFLMGGGNTTFDTGKYDQTSWEKIVPVDMRAYGQGHLRHHFEIDIPESVLTHPLWTISPDPKENQKILEAHPIFTGMNHVRRAKPGALVLATLHGTDEPVIAAQQYGRGRAVAFLPDPNGGSGTFYLDWGPADSPVLSEKVQHIGLGHGRTFRFNEAVAYADYGPEPSHPSPWYGQYWVNMVRWLGENSVRWQRDKFLGRTLDAQARSGQELSVAAEVLAVAETEDLLALDVGARLDFPGSRRVRLLYDRDRREFIGGLSVPNDLADWDEVNVLFDANIEGTTFSQSVAVGVHRGNAEYLHSSPDPVFLADLAEAAGGAVISDLDEALDVSRKNTDKRRLESAQVRNEPLWSHWWPWAVFAVCLSLEWALRRLGGRAASDEPSGIPATDPIQKTAAVGGLLLLAFCLTGSAQGEEKSIDSWIEQLGADRVRLRDKAEAHLREIPEAHDALTAMLEAGENGEAKARATNILRHFMSHRWKLVAIRKGHTELEKGRILTRGLKVSPNRSRIYTRARDFVREWNANSYEPFETFGESAFAIGEEWLSEGICRTLTVSFDSRQIAATNEYGELIFYDFKTRTETGRFTPEEAKPFLKKSEPYLDGIIFFAEFLADRRHLVIGFRRGIRMWELAGKKVKWTSELDVPVVSVVLAPNRRRLLAAAESPESKGRLYTIDPGSGRTVATLELPARLGGLSFDSSGQRLAAFGSDGYAHIFDYDPASGTLSNLRRYGRDSETCQGIAWGPGETTVLLTSSNPRQAITEWDIETGEAVWKSPPIDFGLGSLDWIDAERVAILGTDGVLTVWQFVGE